MNSIAKRHVRAGQVGIALTHFNTKSVAALPVSVPPFAEQQRVVAEVERRLAVAEEVGPPSPPISTALSACGNPF
jgi:type I restriction enzyme S subunit